jgi:hypothetical protein
VWRRLVFVRVNQVLVRLWTLAVACLTDGLGPSATERCSEARVVVHATDVPAALIRRFDAVALSESDSIMDRSH